MILLSVVLTLPLLLDDAPTVQAETHTLRVELFPMTLLGVTTDGLQVLGCDSTLKFLVLCRVSVQKSPPQPRSEASSR